MLSKRTQLWLLLLAGFSLCLGSYVYLAERPYGSSVLSTTLDWHLALPSFLGKLAYSLPSFSHVVAFSILSFLALERRALLCCLSWASINALFELGQHSAVSQLFTLQWADSLAPSIRQFFILGTFDPFDLVAIVSGAICAYSVIQLFRE